jgi:hypothetical protein
MKEEQSLRPKKQVTYEDEEELGMEAAE